MDFKKNMSIDNKNIIINSKNKKSCIYNKNNKKHIFLNEEIIKYLLEGIKNKITFLEFIDAFHEDDKDYIIRILELLNDIEMFEMKETNIEKIKSINIALTHKCNLECKHCWSECSPSKKTKLFLEDWKLVIDKIAYLNPQEIIFSGGEPLILDYFKELVLYTREKMPETMFILSTNATLIDRYNIRFFKDYFEIIDVSIDGYNRETADKIRGLGVFDKVTNNIKRLKQEGINEIKLSMTQGDLNIENREKFKALCDELGVSGVVRTFSPEGRGKDNLNLFLSKDKALPLSIIQMFEQASTQCSQNKSGSISAVACNAGENQLFIDDKANVYPCPSLSTEKFNIANMLSENCISEILEFRGGYSLYESIISQSESCKNCDLNIFCWYCPANFEKACNANELEYWCDSAKKYLDKFIWNEV